VESCIRSEQTIRGIKAGLQTFGEGTGKDAAPWKNNFTAEIAGNAERRFSSSAFSACSAVKPFAWAAC